MHIPTVTDEMLEKVVDAAASPVFVVFCEAGSINSARLRWRVESIADEFDDRVIFLCLSIDENPTPAKGYALEDGPGVVVLKRGRVVGRATGEVTPETIEDLLERAITADA